MTKRRQKGREVPAREVAGLRWASRSLPITNHDWSAEYRPAERDFVVTCSECDAWFRVFIGETDDQWFLSAFIEDAGSGIWRSEVDAFLDWLMEDFQRRTGGGGE